MIRWVLDASVAAKWVLPASDELLVKQADVVLNSFRSGHASFLVPDLFWSEIGNVFWKRRRKGQLSAEAVRGALDFFRILAIDVKPSYPLLDPALDIAIRFDRSVYDSIYVALAARQGIPLLTADQRLVNALAPHNLPICWLGSL